MLLKALFEQFLYFFPIVGRNALNFSAEMRFYGMHFFITSFVMDEIDTDTGATKSTSSTDTMQVRFWIWSAILVGRHVIVDDKGDLKDIDTSCNNVGGDEDFTFTISELVHDNIALCWLEFSVQ